MSQPTIDSSTDESPSLLVRALATISEGTALTDADHNVLHVNEAFTNITGYSREDMLGTNCRILQGPGTDPATLARLRSALESGEVFRGEILNFRKDGTSFWNALTIAPVRDPREGTTHYISVQRDVTLQKALEEQAWFLAHHDPETRLPNRNFLNLRLTEAIDRASHSGGAVAVGIVDLDDFRTVNTSFDHQTGDQVIDETARRLKGQVRRTDFVARIGGDKFAVIIDNLDTARADDQIRATMSHVNRVVEEAFRLPSGQEVSIGMSMGLAVFPRDGDTPGTLLHHADTALHAVKSVKNDRNQWWNTGTEAAAPSETTTTGPAVDRAGSAVGRPAEPSRIHQLVAELQAETLCLIDIRRSTRDKRQQFTDEAAFEWIQQTLEDLTATFIGITGANRDYPPPPRSAAATSIVGMTPLS